MQDKASKTEINTDPSIKNKYSLKTNQTESK